MRLSNTLDLVRKPEKNKILNKEGGIDTLIRSVRNFEPHVRVIFLISLDLSSSVRIFVSKGRTDGDSIIIKVDVPSHFLSSLHQPQQGAIIL